MGIRLLEIFRRYGHVENYSGEVFLIATNCIYLIDVIYYYITEPLLIYVISISDFKCEKTMKYAISALASITHFVRPLSFQVMFIGIVW